MIRARMLTGTSWHDVCILNASPRGLGIQSAQPPTRGTYVEIRRGRQTIIGRVVWSNGHRSGLRSQDPIFISALLNGDDSAAAPSPPPGVAFQERRLQPRPAAQMHDSSRLAGRAMEFACFVVVAGAIGMGLLSAVNEALARPMASVRAALDK